MDIGGLQPHVWFSIFVVLASVGISLLAVVLKRRDDRLREALFEIRMQREEEQRRAFYNHVRHEPARKPQTPSPARTVVQTAPTAGAAPSAKIAAEPAAVTPQTAPQPAASSVEAPGTRDSKARERNLAIRQAQANAVEFTAKSPRRRNRPAPSETVARFDAINPKEALSDWLTRRSAAKPVIKPSLVEARLEALAAPIVEPAAAISETFVAPVLNQVAIPEPVSKPEAPVAAGGKPAVTIDESLWKSILGQSEEVKPAVNEAPKPATAVRFELIAGAGAGLPSGMQDEMTLTRLMDSNKPFSGLALAVAVAQNDGRPIAREVMPHIRQLVRSLILDNEFACQSKDDEFVLLCPAEQLSEAKRRLNAINEGLWDFQLREIGSFSVLFSTGDAQVTNSYVREAVSSARGRLQQTRRVRKMVSLDFSSSRKPASKAV